MCCASCGPDGRLSRRLLKRASSPREGGAALAGVVRRQMDRIESRQASFLAAPALTRRKQKMEKERVQRRREAGCSDPESYVPLDWAEPVGGDVHEIPELRAVGTDVASSTAQQSFACR